MKSDSFWDENGLLHVKKGEYSENGILFAAHWLMLLLLLDPGLKTRAKEFFNVQESICNRCIKKYWRDGKIGFWYDPNPNDENDSFCHFSHDNMTGLYSMLNCQLNNFPTLRWNHRLWLHPRDVIFYSIMHKRIWSYFFLPLLWIMAYISCRKEREHTSGKCLWWLRLQTLKLHGNKVVSWFGEKMYRDMTELLLREHYYDLFRVLDGKKEHVWINVFSIYFKEKDHPVNVLMREYYA